MTIESTIVGRVEWVTLTITIFMFVCPDNTSSIPLDVALQYLTSTLQPNCGKSDKEGILYPLTDSNVLPLILLCSLFKMTL